MDVGCSLRGFGGPTNRQNNMKTHQNCMLASKTRKKHKKTSFGHDKIFFFKISLDEYSYNRPYLQDRSEKKMFLIFFLLREFSSANPSCINHKRHRGDIVGGGSGGGHWHWHWRGASMLTTDGGTRGAAVKGSTAMQGLFPFLVVRDGDTYQRWPRCWKSRVPVRQLSSSSIL